MNDVATLLTTWADAEREGDVETTDRVLTDEVTNAAERPAPAGRWRLGRQARNTVLTIHIVVSVGLLGDSAGFVAVAIRRALSDDRAFVEASHDLLRTFAFFFGIPLSFLALLSGILLGLGTPWGLFKHAWVIAKLILIVSVIVVGATVLRPALAGDASSGSGPLIAGSAYDVAALTTAVGLGVFKPGRVVSRRRTHRTT
jgi:Predicted integral membrane protein (DUF2269)